MENNYFFLPPHALEYTVLTLLLRLCQTFSDLIQPVNPAEHSPGSRGFFVCLEGWWFFSTNELRQITEGSNKYQAPTRQAMGKRGSTMQGLEQNLLFLAVAYSYFGPELQGNISLNICDTLISDNFLPNKSIPCIVVLEQLD